MSPFVKKYKIIPHPGEVNKIREVPDIPHVVVTHTDAPEVRSLPTAQATRLLHSLLKIPCSSATRTAYCRRPLTFGHETTQHPPDIRHFQMRPPPGVTGNPIRRLH
eukprot:70435-Prorocentrum_minimum.AAC.1